MQFLDKEVRGLRPNRPVDLVRLIRLLCGRRLPSNPKELERELRPHAEGIKVPLKNARSLNYEQLNELLLTLNQNRVSRHFFRFFFTPESGRGSVSLNGMKEGVAKFRGFAMLCYGNFRYAFRRLSTISEAEFDRVVQKQCQLTPKAVAEKYRTRPRKIMRIQPIPKDKTWYIGYLSSRKRDTDFATWLAIVYKLGYPTRERILAWKQQQLWRVWCDRYRVSKRPDIRVNYGSRVYHELDKMISRQSRKYATQIARKAHDPGLDAATWAPQIDQVLRVLESMRVELESTQAQGARNTNVYLTWDYMDVYVATSMRERWEYEAAHKFVGEVFKRRNRLRSLKVRYFDPTQSYSGNRIDKGLVEALMLKRAKCTLYLAQESETLGKDSELASTLAQGKPVIAYVPQIRDPRLYSREIAKKPLDFIVKRWLQLEAEDIFALSECSEELERSFAMRHRRDQAIRRKGFLEWKTELFIRLKKATSRRMFNLIEAEEVEIRRRLGKDFFELCDILAVGEKHYFNKRAETLRRAHPLAIQVNLKDGVANGVLVVRSAQKCARLIYALLTNRLSFSLSHSITEGMTELKEDITGCPYRVVTDDPKLTNSFWNFYLTGETIGY
jgi:hypothetical protein